jgi:hypothetical protein
MDQLLYDQSDCSEQLADSAHESQTTRDVLTMNEQEQLRVNSSNGAPPKRRYQPPTLTVFGKVALLTQSQSGCSKSDNPACSAGSSMGAMA